jgi:hypothetical protein
MIDMNNHQRDLTEYLIDELRDRDILFNEYLLETIVEIALYYYEYTDSDDENELNNYLYNSLINVGYVPRQFILNTVSTMIIEYMKDNELIAREGNILFTFENEEEE